MFIGINVYLLIVQYCIKLFQTQTMTVANAESSDSERFLDLQQHAAVKSWKLPVKIYKNKQTGTNTTSNTNKRVSKMEVV